MAKKWLKKKLRRRGKVAGPQTNEVCGKKLSPWFSSSRDGRACRMSGKCAKKGKIIDRLMQDKSAQELVEIKPTKILLRRVS